MAEEITARLNAALAGRYVVERQVGRGGMATVFLATDVRHERRVAIKVLHPELAASMGSERFLREIRLAATLQHPHILGLYDSGDAGGLFFYVMPFVEGESLRDRLDREKQLSIDDALQIARESASALDYAHRQGVVHRDIKPENILLVDGHAIVADFGIARAVSVAGAEKLTETGMAVGTPTYMSPEQASGEQNIDGRSDTYALGCVLYEMLIGEPPFRGPNAMAILARHTLESVPSLQIVRNTVPDEVEDAVMRALAKAPADRFPTAGQLEKALLISSTTVSHRATERALRAQTATMRVKQRRLGVISAGVAFAVIAFGVFAFSRNRGTMLLSAGGRAPSHVAVLYFTDASADKSLGYLADGLTESLIAQLSRVEALDVRSAAASRAFRSDSITPDSVARALDVGTLVSGSVRPLPGDQLRVDMQMNDAGGATLGTKSVTVRRSGVLALRDSVARDVADLIRARIGKEVSLRSLQSGTSDPNAWILEQRAEQGRRRAQELARSGDTAAIRHEVATADSLARQAQSLDGAWGEPLALRGWLAYEQSRRFGVDGKRAAPFIALGL
ncbi:MAG: serine/threonine-protein kinase, partial [Gemmatimonadaceae bacterium]